MEIEVNVHRYTNKCPKTSVLHFGASNCRGGFSTSDPWGGGNISGHTQTKMRYLPPRMNFTAPLWILGRFEYVSYSNFFHLSPTVTVQRSLQI